MPTGSFEGNTTRDVANPDRGGGALVNYKASGACCCSAGWSATPTGPLTGPVDRLDDPEQGGFIGDAANPATLGGLVGSMFFLGYMLTQYPGGRLGDRFGHREMIIVSLLCGRAS